MLKKDEKVGDYTLIEKVGSGGFGEVWKAEKRTSLSVSTFAIKFFRAKDEEDIDLETVIKEVSIWQRLSGLPHIISVIEGNQFKDYVYIVSEFADGGSLDKWLRNNSGKAKSYQEAVAIVSQILQGLEGMHSEGFVHRDLKPANVLVKRNILYLADFGISRQMKTHSKTTGTAGTYDYMPPEAFASQPLVSVHTDIWAAGVLLQKLLTGRLPFPQQEIPSLIGAIVMHEPQPLPEDMPVGLKEIIKKALQKKREDRFQSALEMQEALRDPQRFLESQILAQSATLIDKDPETETIVVEPTRDWRAIEAERTRQQQAKQLKQNGATQLLPQNDTQDQQAKISKIEPGQKSSQNLNIALKILAVLIGIVLFILLFGMLMKGIYNENFPPKKDGATNTQQINNTSNKPANVVTNKSANTSTTPNNLDIYKNSIGMEFVKISAGSFMMGSDNGKDNERPVHKVTISTDFYIGEYEVTQAQWIVLMGTNPSNFKGDNLPVENVSWDDAQNFITKLNAKGEGTYRLPTEAEWEYAARAGMTGDYAGDLDSTAWYLKNTGDKTHEVGAKQPNAWGLYDMQGNVSEWCQDWVLGYPSGSVTDPKGAKSGFQRVVRGGNWTEPAEDLRTAYRGHFDFNIGAGYLGFRLIRTK